MVFGKHCAAGGLPEGSDSSSPDLAACSQQLWRGEPGSKSAGAGLGPDLVGLAGCLPSTDISMGGLPALLEDSAPAGTTMGSEPLLTCPASFEDDNVRPVIHVLTVEPAHLTSWAH